ncbi:MAG: hypothetical protein U5R31_15460 [Acidimicrobiia bacterium]|nr:hypothetical protein [Acidimicrobiia bacterium]
MELAADGAVARPRARRPGPLGPEFVPGSTDTQYAGLSGSARSVTLTSTGLVAGDLWVALLAYDGRGDASIAVPTGSGWNATGPVLIGNTGGDDLMDTVRRGRGAGGGSSRAT